MKINRTLKEEVARMIKSTDPRDSEILRQALYDADACRESRRSNASCGCACCEARAVVVAMGYDVHSMKNRK